MTIMVIGRQITIVARRNGCNVLAEFSDSPGYMLVFERDGVEIGNCPAMFTEDGTECASFDDLMGIFPNDPILAEFDQPKET